MRETGHCKHGEFNLDEGCPQCIADKMAVEGNTEASTEEAIAKVQRAESTAETALATKPGADLEVISYYTEALKLRKYAEERVISSVEDVKVATDDLSVISKLKKAMENKRKEYLEPLRTQAEAIRETYSTLMDPILGADKITRDKMLDFNREQERIRAEQEEINRKRQEAAEAEMKLKGELTESVNLVEVAPEVKRVSTEMGTAGMKDNWKYEVVDFSAVPDEYKVIDSSLLTAIARKHHDRKPVTGIRFYNEPVIAVRAK